MTEHSQLPDAGQLTHFQIDDLLSKLAELAEQAPTTVTGARDTPEEALANLLTALATLGIITDSTTET